MNSHRTATTNVVVSGRVPLPSLNKADSLRDYPITCAFGATHQAMVKGNIGTGPAGIFSNLHSVFVPVSKIHESVFFAFDHAWIEDDWGVINIRDDDLRLGTNSAKPVLGVDRQHRVSLATGNSVCKKVALFLC